MNKKFTTVALVLIANLAFAGEVQTLNPDTLPAPLKNRFSHGKVVPGASTAVGVAVLANPAYLVEVALVAARVPETRANKP